jgi:hypothetical protein
MRIKQVLSILTLCVSTTALAHAQQAATPLPSESSTSSTPSAPTAQTGSINGTVTDTQDNGLAGAAITLTSSTGDVHKATSNANGFFAISDLPPGTYHADITMQDFTPWKSSDFILKPGQDLDIPDITLQVGSSIVVTAVYSPAQIAMQQVKVEEEQRILGVIPNFYTVYDPNPVPLTVKLKFQLAMKATIDPVTFVVANIYAGMEQAASTPAYVEGAKGYGQRLGAIYADGVSDILIGGAILPSLLHQDPRYFYSGKGTKKHRVLYAMSAPFICKGDNGKWQPNYSSVLGDLASGAISNAYYPEVNRGVGLVFTSAAIGAGGRMVNALAQEFLLRKLTSHVPPPQPQPQN